MMTTRLRLLVLLASVALLLSTAQADKEASHRDRKYRYSVDAPKDFRWFQRDGLLGGYAGPGDSKMSLSRVAFPNVPAWRKREHGAFIESVVEGARSTSKDFRKRSERTMRVGGVPALDLHFSRTGDKGTELVWMRFLFYRKYSIVASASTPARAARSQRSHAKAFTRSLAPLRDPSP